MFEETGIANYHVDKVRGRVRLVFIQATFGAGAGTATQDAANSSPATTFTGTTGTYAFTFPPGDFVQFLYPVFTGAANLTGRITAFNSSAGTGTLVLSANPADGVRMWFTLNVGRTG